MIYSLKWKKELKLIRSGRKVQGRVRLFVKPENLFDNNTVGLKQKKSVKQEIFVNMLVFKSFMYVI